MSGRLWAHAAYEKSNPWLLACDSWAKQAYKDPSSAIDYSTNNTPPTPTAMMSGEAATSNALRGQPRRCSIQPRIAPATNQSGIDNIARDPTQTHTFCSLPGASKAITAVITASGAMTAAHSPQATVSTTSIAR